jgi:predicted O-methyltransferase YrrM
VTTQAQYLFTTDWFARVARPTWDLLIPQLNPTTILEIGSFEGASACFLLERLAPKPIELHCVDTWTGTWSDRSFDMLLVEQRFHHNIQLARNTYNTASNYIIHKGRSDEVLPKLLSDDRKEYFDFIYIDGSHQAPDILFDAVLSFQLLKKGGVIAFDDYLWSESPPNETNLVHCPKIAIDTFTNIYCQKIQILMAPLYQLYVQKLSD